MWSYQLLNLKLIRIVQTLFLFYILYFHFCFSFEKKNHFTHCPIKSSRLLHNTVLYHFEMCVIKGELSIHQHNPSILAANWLRQMKEGKDCLFQFLIDTYCSKALQATSSQKEVVLIQVSETAGSTESRYCNNLLQVNYFIFYLFTNVFLVVKI